MPVRHCAACRTARPFRSSGKVRLNANGQKLDAWLIYRCTGCDGTWNRPLLDRRPVSQVRREDLDAMQRSDPDWVAQREFDLAGLRSVCDDIRQSDAVAVKKATVNPAGDLVDCDGITLEIVSPVPIGVRLDRLLAQELPLSRNGVLHMERDGILMVRPASSGLRRAVGRGAVVSIAMACLAEDIRLDLAAAIASGPVATPSGRSRRTT